MPNEPRDPGRRFAGLGFEFTAGVAGLVFLGYWIDRHFESTPWGMLSGLGIGLVGGTYNLIKAALEMGRPQGSSGPSGETDGGADSDATHS